MSKAITDELNKVWDVELEILDVIHSICIKNGLKYSLAFGSMIGAIRHKGFIPWDDDMDIFMPREDYEKFISIWNETPPVGYVLQNKFTNNSYSQNFTKIRKDHTAFVTFEEEKKRTYHKGIFVDIFPGDRLATSSLQKKIQKLVCAFNLLYSREFSDNSGGVFELCQKILLLIPHPLRVFIYKCTNKLLQKYNGCTENPWIFPCTMEWTGKYYPKDMFDNLHMVPFEDRFYYCSHLYEQILKNDYGNYMEFPPEEDRVLKHTPVVISFTHNYEELRSEESV